MPRFVRSREKVLQNLLRKRSRPDPTCDDDPWSTLVENLWSSGMQVSYTIAPAMHTALFTLIRSRRVCELTCTCGHLGRLGRHECERHVDLPKRDSWMYRHIIPALPCQRHVPWSMASTAEAAARCGSHRRIITAYRTCRRVSMVMRRGRWPESVGGDPSGL